jgi:hypothetical protein
VLRSWLRYTYEYIEENKTEWGGEGGGGSRSKDLRLNTSAVSSREDIEEQPTPRNLSATATRVLQCTSPVAASRKYFSAIGALSP